VIKTQRNTMSEAEYDQLSDILDRFQHEQAMNLEMLDGFFTALNCSPETPSSDVYLPEIWGGAETPDEEAFENDKQSEIFVDLLLRHWNDVLHRLKNEEVFLPILLSDESHEASGNDWAKGFIRGTEYCRADWKDLMNNEEEGGAFVTIFVLLHENDPDPEMRPYKEPVSDALREKLLISLSVGIMHIYKYFEPHRRMAAQLAKQEKTFCREQSKTGRNDPCPCGSGKKYKKCCGAIALH
jgi:uncharacterized protein